MNAPNTMQQKILVALSELFTSALSKRQCPFAKSKLLASLDGVTPAASLGFLQSVNRLFHFVKMRLRIHRVGDVDDFSVEADEKTHTLGHAHDRHFYVI